MKLSDKTYILILIVIILGLSYVSYGQFKKFGQSLNEISFPKIEIPEINLEEIFISEKEGDREWVSPDGKLKLTYSANWMETDQTFLEYFGQTGISLAKTDLLLFAYQFDLKKQNLALLTVNKNIDQESLEEILEEMERNVEEQGGEIKIDASETENGIVWLKIISKFPDQPNFYSKGKVLFNENEIYLVIFTSYQADWPKFEQEAQEILNSAHLVL